jgi:hypothetical protein
MPKDCWLSVEDERNKEWFHHTYHNNGPNNVIRIFVDNLKYVYWISRSMCLCKDAKVVLISCVIVGVLLAFGMAENCKIIRVIRNVGQTGGAGPQFCQKWDKIISQVENSAQENIKGDQTRVIQNVSQLGGENGQFQHNRVLNM